MYDSEAHDMEFSPADAKHTLVAHTILSNVLLSCPTGRTRKEHLTWFYRWRVQSLKMQVGDADHTDHRCPFFGCLFSKSSLTSGTLMSHMHTHITECHITRFVFSLKCTRERRDSTAECRAFDFIQLFIKTMPTCLTWRMYT